MYIEFRGLMMCQPGGWVYGDLIYTRHNNGHMIQDHTGCGTDVEEESIGQYVGRTDKDGRKIFSGDIVEISSIPGDVKTLYVVGFDHRICGFGLVSVAVWKDREYRYVWNLFENFSRRTFSMKVVGNIHENKDLLK